MRSLMTIVTKAYILKLKQFAVVMGMGMASIGASGAVVPANALTFNFAPAAGTSQLAIDGFNAAGAMWSAALKDSVSVNINIDFKALDPGVLGEASSNTRTFSYGQVYNALKADRSSADDNAAVNSLSQKSTFDLLLNRTANSPTGSGSATPYLDNNGNANNSNIVTTTANAKALGLQGNGGNDASISFSNLFTWDFDRNDGIGNGAFDFVGIAAHEIGHALGFISGVDLLDANSSNPQLDSQFSDVTSLDLFRYSTDSKDKGIIDWTADKRDKYLSLDRGVTKIASFSTGINFGDGNQASHWQDNLALGIMTPRIAPGDLLEITENDRRALDAIGWNRVGNNAINGQQQSLNAIGSNRLVTAAASTAVPEPGNYLGTFIIAAIGVKIVLNRRQVRL